MSDPAHLFQSLRLDDMPVTRSQAHVPQQRGGRNPRSNRGRGRGRGRAQAPPTRVVPVRIFTGRQYYTQDLSPVTAQRAIEGLDSNFSVDAVQSRFSGHEKYYAFQLGVPVTVRIYEPTGGHARIVCSCESHQGTQSECIHIFSLFAGLHAVLTDQQIASTQTPMPIELPLTSQLGRLYPLIEQRQKSLHQELKRVHDDGIDAGIDDVMQDQDTRTDTLCDILSSFDNATPSEFKHDLTDPPAAEISLSHDGTLVPGHLSATIYHLACRDDAFYGRLQQVVPPDARADQYYQIQYGRAQRALLLLSRHAETGPTSQHLPGGPSDMDVPECAKCLRSIVDQMCVDRDARTEIAPLGADVLVRLAEILGKLIDQVVTSDRNAYETVGIQPPNGHPRDRNLFVYLIGDPPSDPGLPQWMTDKFAIDRLRGFPPDAWSRLLELLTTIKDRIEEKDMDAMPASFAYVAKIDDMLRDYTATANEPSSSSAQMPSRG